MSEIDRSFRVRNVGSGLLLEVYGGRTAAGVRVQQGSPPGSGDLAGQLWRITPVYEGSALRHVVSVASGKRLDVTGASLEPGAPIQQWRANNFGAQEWLLEEHVAKPGTYSLVSYLSGLLLEIPGSSKEEGAPALQGEDIDSPFQWWTLEAV